MMCICCDKKIPLLHEDEKKDEEKIVFEKEKRQIYNKKGRFDEEIVIDAGARMWSDGVIGRISAGYGSIHDGDEYIIGICDECIDKKLFTGGLALIDNYMCELDDEKYKKTRIAWRRYNRINDILTD